ncbi:hypothetical protein C6361_26265 [Plantactinospora sp. BC1]|nr:hypothetical protein C6361_26265 [Plantactinospora sp. BC1]
MFVLAYNPAKGRLSLTANLGILLRAAALADLYRGGHLTDERGRATIGIPHPCHDPRDVGSGIDVGRLFSILSRRTTLAGKDGHPRIASVPVNYGRRHAHGVREDSCALDEGRGAGCWPPFWSARCSRPASAREPVRPHRPVLPAPARPVLARRAAAWPGLARWLGTSSSSPVTG